MSYFIREVITGSVMEVEKWKKPTKEARRQTKREAKANKTSDAQAKVNRENALRRLRWDINANFAKGDYWLTFTYTRDHEPTDESCREDYRRLMRKMRTLYKKAGAEFKYIAICNEPERRPHIHVLVKKGVSLEEIQTIWGYGHIHIKLLDESGQYRQLADYIFKHSAGIEGKKKWYSSKNLFHPQPKERESSANSWREDIKPPKGWMIDKTVEIEKGINPITGAEFIRYSLVKIPMVEKSGHKNARAHAGATTYA